MLWRIGWLGAIVFAALVPRPGLAQQATVGAPAPVVGHSYYENFGLQWGVRGNGWFFNSGGPAPYPFGGMGGGGASLGGRFGGGGLNGGFRLTAEQGSSTMMSSQSPSVTVMNGGTGYFSDTTIRPFVTGLIPVVGNKPTAPQLPGVQAVPINPVHQRLARLEAEGRLAAPKPAAEKPDAAKDAAAEADKPAPLVLGGGGAIAGGPSSAERGDLSVAEIQARRAAATSNAEAEVAGYIAKAEAALADGKPGVARVYFQMAARRTTGERQQELLARIDQLDRAAK